MLKAIIFDLDGVIVSTDDLHYMAWKKIAVQEGIPFDQTINHQLRGVSRMESLEIIISGSSKTYSLEEKQKLAKTKNDYYVTLLDQLSPQDILPGVASTLAWLKNHNFKIAIGSSSKNAKTILSKIGLINMFDVIIDGNDIQKSKPDPEVFLKASIALNYTPQECAVVEDAEAGIEAAKSANMFAIGIGPAAKYNKTDCSIERVDELQFKIMSSQI